MFLLQMGGAGWALERDSKMVALLPWKGPLSVASISAHMRENVNQGEKHTWKHQALSLSWNCPLLRPHGRSPPQLRLQAKPFHPPSSRASLHSEGSQAGPSHQVQSPQGLDSCCCQPQLDVAMCPAPSSCQDREPAHPCQSHPWVLGLHSTKHPWRSC